MLFSNPFSLLSQSIPPALMQAYVVVMLLLVVAGTLLDMAHKQSAKYFFEHARNARRKGTRQVGAAETALLGVQTAAVDVLTSAEFCNQQRRVAHLLTMYGLIIHVVTTVILVFAYPTTATPAPPLVTALWYVGALMVCVGGYWFWFFIRADVAAEGHSPLRLVRADLFIVSLLASATLGLLWALVQSIGRGLVANVLLALYLLATTVLFGSVFWSKFSHMFYKPAAAFQKRMEQANGSRRNLPAPADKPAVFGSGRQQPQNY